jgi:hypothetical protein
VQRACLYCDGQHFPLPVHQGTPCSVGSPERSGAASTPTLSLLCPFQNESHIPRHGRASIPLRLIQTTTLDLFAGIPVADYAAALHWYERLLGSPPTFLSHATEAVWELAAHRYVYSVQQPVTACFNLYRRSDLGNRCASRWRRAAG